MHSWLTRCMVGTASGALACALVLVPGSATAAGTDIVVSGPTEDVPAAPAASADPAPAEVEVEQTPVKVDPQDSTDAEVKRTTVAPYRMVGVTWDADATATDVTVRVQVRTGGVWGGWENLEIDDDLPTGRPGTQPLWTTEPADGIAVEVSAASGTPTGVRATTIDPGKSEVVTPISSAGYDRRTGRVVTAAAANDGAPTVVPMPAIITRAQWGASAGTSCSAPTTQPRSLGVVVHHSAGSNTYSMADSAAIVRSYQSYHVKGHGWCDIGYNFLVDRFGQVFEGRKGGMLNQVRAAHSGVDAVNQWATGVSMMGNFETVAPSEALKDAMVKLVGWRLKYFGDNPKGTYTAGGKRYNVINGHRDVKSTACPGRYAYAWISEVGGLRDRVTAYLSRATSATNQPGLPTLPAPSGVVSTPSTTSVTVSWAPVAGVSVYRVLVSPTGSSAGARYATVTGTTATVSGLNARTSYVVRVAALDAASGARVSAYTAKPYPSVRTRAFPAPTGIRVVKRSSTGLRFWWPALAGAPGYRVAIVPVGKSKPVRFLTTSRNWISIGKLKSRTKYAVRVAVVQPSTGARVSGYTAKPGRYGMTLAAGRKPVVIGVTATPRASTSTVPASASAPRAAAAVATNTASVAGGVVRFKGRGYGHGIGMSQYGAEGGARAGATYDQILARYYPGTALSSRSASIRVHLTADTSNSVYVRPKAGLKFKVLGQAATALPTKVRGRTPTAWSIDNAKADRRKNSLYYKAGSRWYTYRTFSGNAQFQGPSTITLVLPNGSSRSYRGVLRSVAPAAGSTRRDTVNVVNLEHYLRGVVPREMPASWSLEALKAQSVAARTYASRYLGSAKPYDICDTTSCQVYGGYSSEASRSNQAIDATRGAILTFGGKPAVTQFSSSSGGYTNRGSYSYLQPVSDPWDGWSGNKNHTWTIAVKASTIQAKYRSIGTLTSVTVTRRNGYGELGGRVAALKLTGTKGTRTITGVDARWAFGLRSDWFGF